MGKSRRIVVGMEKQPIIECVPNFSEGRDLAVIEAIAAAIAAIPGVKLMHVDIGKDANRTVMTFAGEPEAVVEAAFEAIRVAAEKIDMRNHTGAHPRIGATDVCPLVPVANIAMETVVEYAHLLARRVGEELQIPVYLYEAAAATPQRKNLAVIRVGEYEGLKKKMEDTNWKPDYGPIHFNDRAGATVIGARDFLIAYNLNLSTTAVAVAKAIAGELRESGRSVVENGIKKVLPGRLPAVKAIGWYMDAYGCAQVSTNLTNIHLTPLHIAFETCQALALQHGCRVTGSELIGMLPLEVLRNAGYYFAGKEGLPAAALTEASLIDKAVEVLGLAALGPFVARDRIIEYRLGS